MSSCNDHKQLALKILNSGEEASTVNELFGLSKALKNCRSFNYARRILALAANIQSDRESTVKILQQQAMCTAKDVDLPVSDRFSKAVEILNNPVLDLKNTSNQETLGIAGGIYKRHWEATGMQQYLEMSLHYYGRGQQQGVLNDDGYCAVNTAFVYDLLSQAETLEKPFSPAFQVDILKDWKETARKIREEIVEKLTEKINNRPDCKNWWILVTIAEAKFGLGRYKEAKSDLEAGVRDHKPDAWELETTTKQLARLVMMQAGKEALDIINSEAWNTLKVLLDNPDKNVDALYTAFEGKIGLALSGGGFRASLFHIGVLARLAELDVLRKVEVLSCVSGGSIIGAYYYLEVRQLLQTRTDKDITAKDYIDIVHRISAGFLSGVQRNIRTRVVADWWSNFKMLFWKHYSRTLKVGELYEKELFSRIQDDKQRWLNELFIHPMREDGTPDKDFNPKHGNWMRYAKVPVLILNATTLNTGHNWQFTASWMGESPAAIQEIDGNYRLRRTYYKTSGEEKYQRKIKLGTAVGASSCVPGMFEPVVLPYLYEGKIVRLVDGGVHDNQGIGGLLEQDCDVLIVSDASGQMGAADDPPGSALGVPLRSNDILMERVRNAQYLDLKKRKEAGLLKGMMFIHLKKDLNVEAVDWINCEDPAEKSSDRQQYRLTLYGIRKDVQAHIAAIRTDLDSFHDTEAYSLMASGYEMTKTYFSPGVKLSIRETRHEWDFIKLMHNDLSRPDLEEHVLNILKASGSRTFKVWQLSKALKITALCLKILAGLLLIALIFAGIFYWHSVPVITIGKLAKTVLFFVLGLYLAGWVIHLFRPQEWLMRLSVKLGLTIIACMVARLHLMVFDRLYLKKGRRKSHNP